MKILVTGSAGFIGSALTLHLLQRGDEVIGVDNHNDYYDPALKEARLARYLDHPAYTHLRIDVADQQAIETCFINYKPDRVVHLAAQAGVRYSLDNPSAYIDSNVVGFLNILEGCRRHHVDHLVYASSSSVYGANTKIPFSIHDNAEHPLSLYAATKRSNELMAHTYSHLFNLPTTGLRLFTVYGPWGRPDMALYKFTKAILSRKKIPVFNYGEHQRDFTYIEDVVEGVARVLNQPPKPNNSWNAEHPDLATSMAPWRLYNIGSSSPVKLIDFIKVIEEKLGKKANLDLLPLQPGDVLVTYADIEDSVVDFCYKPSTSINKGIEEFIWWYRSYYK